jgi:hypothetical protein
MAPDVGKHGGRPGPSNDVVVGDAGPADGSRAAVECRFRVSDTNLRERHKSEFVPEIYGEEGNA